MRSKIRSAIAGARPIDGSSRSNSCGEEAMPRPIASICCSPPDSVPATWERRSASTGKSAKMRSMLRCHVGSAAPRIGAHLEVFQHRHRCEDLPSLRHMGDAEMHALMRRNGQEVPSLVSDRTSSDRNHSRDGLEQGRLAGPIGPDDRDELALLDRDRNPAQGSKPAVIDRKPLNCQKHRRARCVSGEVLCNLNSGIGPGP